jgi:hypothetical protein
VTGWTGEALRRDALAVLGPFGDERARDALGRGVLEVTAAGVQWQSSSGPVEGVRVTLALDAGALEQIRTAPALRDAICAALAAAVASRRGESLFEFLLRLREPGDLDESPYRGHRPGG